MGCPPDPIEVSLSRGNEDSNALKEKADLLIPQAQNATQRFLAFCKIHSEKLSKEYLNTAEKLSSEASRYSSRDLGKNFNWNDFGETSGPYHYPNMSVLYSHLSDSESYVKGIEISLCITRDLFLKAVKRIGEKSISVQELKDYQEEKEFHLAHRREDKEIKLKTIQDEMETCTFVMTTKDHDYSKEERKEYAEKLKKLEPEFKRISALTDEELLNDRNLF